MTREDQIKKAAEIIAYGCSDELEAALIQDFPEIKESEDERMENDIIKAIRITWKEEYAKRLITYLEKQKEQNPAEWSGEDDAAFDYLNELIGFGFTKNFFDVQTAADMRKWVNKRLKFIRPQPAKSPLAEGVYYIKDGQPVAEYEAGVETDRLLIIGKYCRFYLSMADLGKATYEYAQNKAASLGEGWRCPDSFEGRTIGLASDEIMKKAGMLGTTHFDELYWFWTNEQIGRWDACVVRFSDGNVSISTMSTTSYVLALSAFQN